MNKQTITRPPLDAALAAWQESLARHGLPAEPLWIFSENLCIEPSHATPGSFRFGFQTKFTPPDHDALEIAYDHFCGTDARIVFYRLGSAPNKSVCILLCDPWFEEKTSLDGFERRDEEVTELTRWVRRVKHDRAFHDFDFGMALETIDEIKFHGRPLLPYERMAQRMLNRLRRMLGQSE
jgi:hypothetical protein